MVCMWYVTKILKLITLVICKHHDITQKNSNNKSNCLHIAVSTKDKALYKQVSLSIMMCTSNNIETEKSCFCLFNK